MTPSEDATLDLGTPHLRFERIGSVGWCTVDRPEARNALTSAMRSRVKALINSRYGVIDEMSLTSSVASDEVIEGFRAFTEKRTPSWVPEEFRTEGRL